MMMMKGTVDDGVYILCNTYSSRFSHIVWLRIL